MILRSMEFSDWAWTSAATVSRLSCMVHLCMKPSLANLLAHITSPVKPTPQKGFFTNVKSTLEQPLFTVYLNHGHPGTYDFGFISPSKMITAISWVPALVSPKKGWWIVTATGYSVAGDKHVTSDYLEAVVDTGDTYLLLPQRICDQYYAKAPSVVKDHAYGYVFPCSDTLPDITLYIGGYNTTVPGWLLKGGQIDSTSEYTSSAYVQDTNRQ